MELGGLLSLLIYIIIVAVIVAVVLWCVRYFLPQFYEPAKFIAGAIALIAILIKVAAYIGVVV